MNTQHLRELLATYCRVTTQESDWALEGIKHALLDCLPGVFDELDALRREVELLRLAYRELWDGCNRSECDKLTAIAEESKRT